MRSYDVAVIGGGIVGTATALALTTEQRLSVIVLEAEDALAAHQSGHNSGVIHSGLYYRPGSLKARDCRDGAQALYQFCAEHGITHRRCGKLVVATSKQELPALDELERRGFANGLTRLERLGPEGIRAHEPHAAGIAGLFVPETGIVDFRQVTEAFARVVHGSGGTIRTRARLVGVRRDGVDLVLQTTAGEIRCGHLVNCAGLQSDRVARLCGVDPGVRILPFRGEYYELVPERRGLVRALLYPVPDPRFPFLGVHFTRTIHDSVEAGPNAVLALRREGYRRFSLSPRDLWQMACYAGTWRMAARYWRTGFGELYRSLSKAAFVRALQRLLPDVRPQDLRRGGSGVRAQAVTPSGALLDDFHIVQAERMVHVVNAPSPAATASISIGRTIAAMVIAQLALPRR
jgi:L-2-hydroxyglutarate oxidase